MNLSCILPCNGSSSLDCFHEVGSCAIATAPSPSNKAAIHRLKHTFSTVIASLPTACTSTAFLRLLSPPTPCVRRHSACDCSTGNRTATGSGADIPGLRYGKCPQFHVSQARECFQLCSCECRHGRTLSYRGRLPHVHPTKPSPDRD